jgi:hypothetical protein
VCACIPPPPRSRTCVPPPPRSRTCLTLHRRPPSCLHAARTLCGRNVGAPHPRTGPHTHTRTCRHTPNRLRSHARIPTHSHIRMPTLLLRLLIAHLPVAPGHCRSAALLIPPPPCMCPPDPCAPHPRLRARLSPLRRPPPRRPLPARAPRRLTLIRGAYPVTGLGRILRTQASALRLWRARSRPCIRGSTHQTCSRQTSRRGWERAVTRRMAILPTLTMTAPTTVRSAVRWAVHRRLPSTPPFTPRLRPRARTPRLRHSPIHLRPRPSPPPPRSCAHLRPLQHRPPTSLRRCTVHHRTMCTVRHRTTCTVHRSAVRHWCTRRPARRPAQPVRFASTRGRTDWR